MARLAVFLQDLRGGGAERMLLNLAHGFAAAGHEVDLVLVRAEGDYLPLVEAPVKIVDLECSRTAAAVPALARYLKQTRPQALLSGLVHINVCAILANMLAGRPTRIVVSERNTISVDADAAESRLVRWAHKLVHYLYPRAAAITAVSGGVADDLAAYARLDRGTIHVINNPVITPRLRKLSAEAASHPWLKEGGATKTVIAAGRLDTQKDFGTLLEAFAQVLETTKARLVVFGEGPKRQELEERARALGIEAHVDFPGFTQNPYAEMAAADLFVLSSRWEGSPNVLVEAMACGTPVVATDCPSGPRETLKGGALGPLVPVGDAAALAEGIRQALDAPADSERLRGRAADFSQEKSAQDYLAVMLG